MFCMSVSFKTTPLPIRQRFAFTGAEQQDFLARLLEHTDITGGVVVSTCNRSELYVTGKPCCIEEIEDLLSGFKHIDKEIIKKNFLYYQGQKAVRHLFQVACGLESMVLGEDEILRQVKEAYLSAARSGYTDSELNIIFQGAFNCAKLSKSGTRLSNTPVSIGTLTANRVEEYLKKTAHKNRDKVLVIGATGKIGSIVAKDLTAKGISVIGTRRKRQQVQGIFVREGAHMEWLDFEDRYEALQQAAAVVSATSSPHYTLTHEAFARYAPEGEEFLLVDLAVPCDIDKAVGRRDGITLLDIDHFRALSAENTNIKLGELDKAEGILQECLEDVLKKLYMREFRSKMADRCREKWFEQMACYLKDVLDSEQLAEVFEKIYQRERQEAE